MSWRMKSKSGWLAAGKPTSISLKPIWTTASNMRRLRTGSIGSISAWLPSRRSTEHHRGALSMTRSGQVRSVRTSGICGRYLPNGIGFGVTGCGGMVGLLAGSRCDGRRAWPGRKMKNPPAGRRGAGERAGSTLALRKQEEVGPGHRLATLHRRAPAEQRAVRRPTRAGAVATRRPPRDTALPGYPGRHHDRSDPAAGSPPPPAPGAPTCLLRSPAHISRHLALTTIAVLPPVEPPTGFADLGVPARIDDGLAAAGFAQPFMIQTAAIPVAMQGRDVCGRARTGSGKTLAFGVPMLSRIVDRAEPARPLGLVLVPTRELAVQVAEVLEPVATFAGQRVLAGVRRGQQAPADRRAARRAWRSSWRRRCASSIC